MYDPSNSKCLRRHILLSGGRMTKWKGRVASLSPHIGELSQSVSAIAFAGALFFGGGSLLTPNISLAGSCSGSGGIYSCSGAANSTTDVTQSISSNTLSVTTNTGFGHSVASGNGLFLYAVNGLTFTDTHASSITGSNDGVRVQNGGYTYD